jgi:hypothetical protein
MGDSNIDVSLSNLFYRFATAMAKRTVLPTHPVTGCGIQTKLFKAYQDDNRMHRVVELFVQLASIGLESLDVAR